MEEKELEKRKRKKKKKLEELEIEEEGMHPLHEKYTKEGIIKEG